MDTFGDRLRDLRNRKGWTQALLAERSGLEARRVGEFELRAAPPMAKYLVALADALGVSVDYLLGREKQRRVKR